MGSELMLSQTCKAKFAASHVDFRSVRAVSTYKPGVSTSRNGHASLKHAFFVPYALWSAVYVSDARDGSSRSGKRRSYGDGRNAADG
jgi:hypothetical protein